VQPWIRERLRALASSSRLGRPKTLAAPPAAPPAPPAPLPEAPPMSDPAPLPAAVLEDRAPAP